MSLHAASCTCYWWLLMLIIVVKSAHAHIIPSSGYIIEPFLLSMTFTYPPHYSLFQMQPSHALDDEEQPSHIQLQKLAWQLHNALPIIKQNNY